MIDRKEIQKQLVEAYERIAEQVGCDTKINEITDKEYNFTVGELIEAAKNDTTIVGTTMNPIDEQMKELEKLTQND